MTWSLESPQLALVRRAVETAPMVDGVERQTARAQLRALLDENERLREAVQEEMGHVDHYCGEAIELRAKLARVEAVRPAFIAAINHLIALLASDWDHERAASAHKLKTYFIAALDGSGVATDA